MSRGTPKGDRIPEFFLGGYDPQWVKERRLFPPAEYLQNLVAKVSSAKDALTAIQLDPVLRVHSIVRVVEDIERALNPEGRPWADPEKRLTTFAFWPETVKSGCKAIRGRMDEILKAGGMEWVCDDSMPNGWDVPGGNWQDFLGQLQGHLEAIHQAAGILSSGLAKVSNTIGGDDLADQETGYLGILIDEVERTVRRQGFEGVADFAGKRVLWPTFVALLEKKGKVVKDGILRDKRDYSIESNSLSKRIKRINEMTAHLGLLVDRVEDSGYKLVEQ